MPDEPANEIQTPAEPDDGASNAPAPSGSPEPDTPSNALTPEELDAAMPDAITPEAAPAAQTAETSTASETPVDTADDAIHQDEVQAVLPSAQEAGTASDPSPATEAPRDLAGSALESTGVEAAMEALAAVPDDAADLSATASETAAGAGDSAEPFLGPDFSNAGPQDDLAHLDLLNDVELDVKIELGRTEMYIEDVLRLGVGSVLELDKLAGDPVDIFVNEKLVARGEVLVLNENFCVRINDILSPVPELEGQG